MRMWFGEVEKSQVPQIARKASKFFLFFWDMFLYQGKNSPFTVLVAKQHDWAFIHRKAKHHFHPSTELKRITPQFVLCK